MSINIILAKKRLETAHTRYQECAKRRDKALSECDYLRGLILRELVSGEVDAALRATEAYGMMRAKVLEVRSALNEISVGEEELYNAIDALLNLRVAENMAPVRGSAL